MIWGLVGAGLGALGGLWDANARAKQIKEQVEAQQKAAKYKYSAIEASILLANATNREMSMNLVGEALRAGAAKNREVKLQIQDVASKLQAKSEGLTSGQTAGRQMAALYIGANKALSKVDRGTKSIINKVTQTMDDKTNELNNRQIQAYQEMVGVLTAKAPSVDYTGSILSGAISGAKIGYNFGQMFGSYFDFGGSDTTYTQQPTSPYPQMF
ncbi:MAG: hypothetical protein B6U76_00130 [Desulfurococcales archaeon ex4484_217_2]|nr:MAG: hypothetical protein B6U76_00130 [Desulfurococcales archaeon ex4484_217_2]